MNAQPSTEARLDCLKRLLFDGGAELAYTILDGASVPGLLEILATARPQADHTLFGGGVAYDVLVNRAAEFKWQQASNPAGTVRAGKCKPGPPDTKETRPGDRSARSGAVGRQLQEVLQSCSSLFS